jgi:hypothetical protein
VEAVGPAGGQGLVGREAGGLAWGVGRWQITRAGQKKEGGRAEIIAQAEIHGSKRKINLIDFLDKNRIRN